MILWPFVPISKWEIAFPLPYQAIQYQYVPEQSIVTSNNGGASVPDYLVDLLEGSSVHLDNEQVKVLQNMLFEYKDVFSKFSDELVTPV